MSMPPALPLSPLITFLASFLIWFLFAGLLVLWVIDGPIKKEQVLHALMAVVIAWGASQMIKSIVPTDRPFVHNDKSVLTLTLPSGNAFPSSHTAIAFALSTAIYLHDKKKGYAFFAAAILVGVGRVLGNVHYPLDILGGSVLGIAVAFALENVHFPIDS